MAYEFGVKNILVGAIAAGGGLATEFASLGKTKTGTVAFNPTEAKTEELRVEEESEPVLEIITEPESTTFSWSIVEWSNDLLLAVWGGEVNQQGQWMKPSGQLIVEKSLKLEKKQGKTWIYPRVRLTGNPSYDQTKTVYQVDMKAKVLQPEQEGLSSWIVGEPEEA
jgi:hypothetical protein